jgi:hypothetical protein
MRKGTIMDRVSMGQEAAVLTCCHQPARLDLQAFEHYNQQVQFQWQIPCQYNMTKNGFSSNDQIVGFV